jgi:hypothetical protein
LWEERERKGGDFFGAGWAVWQWRERRGENGSGVKCLFGGAVDLFLRWQKTPEGRWGNCGIRARAGIEKRS